MVQMLSFGISSMDADSAIALVKSQRVGNTGTFVSTQLNNVPLGSLMQYQLEITNNTPSGATLGGTVVNLPFNDTLPVSLKMFLLLVRPLHKVQGVQSYCDVLYSHINRQ